MISGTITKTIEDIIGRFSTKQQKIMNERFGLKSSRKQTLQKIGEDLSITRERVRQIIEATMKEIRSEIVEKASALISAAKTHLLNAGGVRRDDYYIDEIKYHLDLDSSERYLDEKIRFILWTSKAVGYEKESDSFRSYWYASDESRNELRRFLDRITDFFKTNDRKEILREKSYLKEVNNFREAHYITIPKYIGINVFGEIGLLEWPEIEPKTIRDKIYLTLKKHGEPLHFEKIAKQITRYGIDRKSVHVQTVHNELIKDKRFVLVGRGIYALQENGYQPGTVKEVIVQLMKDHGPLNIMDVVRLVNEKRYFKENTILLNLQNRKFFKRLDDGRYHVKEA